MKKPFELIPLNEAVFIQEGPGIRSYEYQKDGYPIINVRCVQNGYIDLSNCNAANVALATGKWRHFQVDEGDILFTISGSIGRTAIVKKEDLPLLMNTSVVRFRSKTTSLRNDYFYYYLQSWRFLAKLHGLSSGTAQKNVGPTHLKTMDVPVPPLAEQRRIVGILDAAFDGIAKARVNAEKNLQNARDIFQSHLNSIFTHRDKNWADNKLRLLTTKIGSGATPRGGEESYKPEGISLIRSLNVHDLGFKYSKLAFLDDAQANELSNVEVQRQDVLLNITGASVARCCIVPDDVLPARVNQHVSIIRPVADKLNAGFLHYLLISKPYKDQLLQTGAEGGSTRQAITKAQIQDFTVKYPATLKEQKSIVDDLHGVIAETRRLESLYARKLTALDELKAALLHRAFSGAL